MKYIHLVVVLLVVAGCPGFAEAEENRFSLQYENTVLVDSKTGLMWPVQDNGFDISWPAGKAFCEGFSLAGYGDWRMPTREELASLYNLKAADSSEYYIDLRVKVTACCQWAIDTQGPKVGSFDFEYGNRDWGYPMSTVDARVLPVRNTGK